MNQRIRESESPSYLLPPQNFEAEESVLGRIIQDNKILSAVRGFLEPDDFHKTAHRKIFSAMLKLADQEKTVDLVTLANQLQEDGQLEAVGGAIYLASLVDDMPETKDAVVHARIVKDKAIRRLILEKAHQIAKAIYDSSVRTNDIIIMVNNMPSEIMEHAAKGNDVEKLEFSPEDLQNHFSPARETPYERLNHLIIGFMTEELTVIGGKSGMGKTALALNFSSHTAIDQNQPVIYCGALMTKKKIYNRLLAQRSRINLKKIQGQRATEEDELKRMLLCQEQINDAPFYDLILPSRLSVTDLQIAIMGALEKRIKGDIGLLVVENLQQLFIPGKDFKGNTTAEAGAVAEKIREFGIKIKAPVIASSQINRKVGDREDKRPKPTDVFGKLIEEVCDNMFLVFRPNAYKNVWIEEEEGWPERNAEISIGKGAAPVTLPFTFWGGCLSWEERA